MMLVHWGNTNSKHNHSTTAYGADNWDQIPSSKRGIHPCFDPDKDLVLPAWKVPDANVLTSKVWARYIFVQNLIFTSVTCSFFTFFIMIDLVFYSFNFFK